MRFYPAIFVIFFLLPAVSSANPAPHVSVELVNETDTIQPGQTAWVGIRFQIEKGWHLYWKNPGDSGDAPRVSWQLPKGMEAGEIQWPVPSRIAVGPLMNFGYSDSLLLAVPLHSKGVEAGSTAEIQGQVKWLVCNDVCIPGRAAVSLSLPVRKEDPKLSPFSPLFSKGRASLPQPLPQSVKVIAFSQDQHMILKGEGSPEFASHKGIFFPWMGGQIENAGTQKWKQSQGGFSLEIPKSDQLKQLPDRLHGVLALDRKAFLIDTPMQVGAAGGDSGNLDILVLLQAVLMAFLGGLILNLMPCVFPVLSIKAIHLIEQAKVHSGEKRSKSVKIEGLLYTLGILVSFWVLDLVLYFFRSTGADLGWGFQLQSPLFVATLSNVLFLMALNLLGVFEIGTSFLGTGSSLSSRKGHLGSFFTGVLATVVATPCTAPFMGTALVFAVGQPPVLSLLVFSGLGLGLALPYVALTLAPGLGRFLPKPGRWMESTKQFLSFPLFGTVIWLVWVLGLQMGMDAVAALLCGLLGLGLGAWAYGRWQDKKIQVLSVLISILFIGMELKTISSPKPETSHWTAFSKAKLGDLLHSGKPVFIDFTAAWCITCKVNEKVALNPSIMEEMSSKGIVAMKGDWTNSDPEITQALEGFGRNGVPLYVLYSGKEGEEPRILPQLLTPSIVRNEIGKIKGESK